MASGGLHVWCYVRQTDPYDLALVSSYKILA